ncbi:MAG: serine/threonine protein kinase [Anaerolineae bacterium]|nr:serine/threonine protein kinase [Phycisphaerae bacterium]
MELKGVKPGVFHPRCVACKEKFLLQIFPDASRAPVVAAEHDAKAETLAPVAMDVAAKPQVANRIASSSVQTVAPAATRPVARAVRETSVAINAGPERSQIVDGTGPLTDDLDAQIVGATIGGYHVTQKLGAGGMGAVYLARQISLDRDVALKVLAPNLANDPQFVARFTREAYAAAQLSHHNVVQIHDIGAQSDLHFFSMEFVEGRTLARLVDEHGKVDAEQAVGLVLQAARGLKYAHDHGLIHRDIKPENLMLNESGIVKVADLGLVKRRGINETSITGVPGGDAGSPDKTQANMSMGTPAYMSPEQATDAAQVDQRADIYSLGCTLYDLLTGRPPFVGRTAMEVITKHQREAVVPPDMVVKNVPRTLSEILLKMIAKKPEQRYQTMTDVIKALEDFLGVAQTGPFTPTEEHTKVLEFAVERFNGSKCATIRNVMIAVFFLLCAALAVFIGMTRSGASQNDEIVRKIQWTGAFVGMAILTSLSYFLITGFTQRTHLYMKFRQLAFGSSLGDWLLWIFVSLGALGLLIVFKQLVPWLIVVGIAVFVACAFHWTIDLALSRERQTPISQVEAMLKTMRLRGLDENSLRQFVCRYSGKRWVEFYEAMFGYEAIL